MFVTTCSVVTSHPSRVSVVAALVERLAGITQRVVHPDLDLPDRRCARVDQVDVGRVVLWCRCADIVVSADVDRRHRVRLVGVFETQRHLVGLVAEGTSFRQSWRRAAARRGTYRSPRRCPCRSASRRPTPNRRYLPPSLAARTSRHIVKPHTSPFVARDCSSAPGASQVRVLDVLGRLGRRRGKSGCRIGFFRDNGCSAAASGESRPHPLRSPSSRIDNRQLRLADVDRIVRRLSLRIDQPFFDGVQG